MQVVRPVVLAAAAVVTALRLSLYQAVTTENTGKDRTEYILAAPVTNICIEKMGNGFSAIVHRHRIVICVTKAIFWIVVGIGMCMEKDVAIQNQGNVVLLLRRMNMSWIVSIIMSMMRCVCLIIITQSVDRGYCASYVGARAMEEKKNGMISSSWMIVGCVGLLVVVLIAVGCFVYRSRQAKKVQFTLDKIAEESEEEEDEGQEVEVEVE
eukprot:772051_1